MLVHSRTCNLRWNRSECKLFIRSIIELDRICVDSLTTINKTATGWNLQNWRIYFFNRLKSFAVQDQVQLNTCTIVGDFHCKLWLSQYFNSSFSLGYRDILQRAWTWHHDPWNTLAIQIFKTKLYYTVREEFTMTYDGKEENDTKNRDDWTSHCRETDASFDIWNLFWLCLTLIYAALFIDDKLHCYAV